MHICICIIRAWLQESCSLLCHFKLLILYIATNHQTLLLLFYFQHPAGVFVHPSGVERSLHDCINAMRSCYGDKQGRKFQVWVDRVSPVQMSSDTWIVKFDKWELSGDERHCCITTVVLSSKGGDASDGFTWRHMHQTWLEGWGVKDHSNWLF